MFLLLQGSLKLLLIWICLPVLVYRCRNMADNCGMCLALSEKYQCGWCQSSLTCEIKEQCDGGESAWLDQQKTCPNPKITNVHIYQLHFCYPNQNVDPRCGDLFLS